MSNEITTTDAAGREGLINRLNRIEGQVRGLQRMLEGGRECEDVITQVMAIRSALEQVGLLLVDHHIHECVLRDVTCSDEALQSLERAMRSFLRFTTIPAAEDIRVPGSFSPS
jgi:CsoR family transcriptional regulator, copper-sensing transcriptional repressor